MLDCNRKYRNMATLKTTIEIPDGLFRKAKTLAAANGVTLKQLVTEALEDRLKRKTNAGETSAAPWMVGFGQLSEHRAETRRIEAAIEEEFERIDFLDPS